MGQRDFDHFFLTPDIFGASKKYKAPSGWGAQFPDRDRIHHANRLLDEYQRVMENALKVRQSRLDQSLPVMDGVQLEFVSKEGSGLALAKLEGRSNGVYLLNERHVKPEGALQFETATVHLPAAELVQSPLIIAPLVYFPDKNADIRYIWYFLSIFIGRSDSWEEWRRLSNWTGMKKCCWRK